MHNTNTIFLFFVGPQFFWQNVRKMLPHCHIPKLLAARKACCRNEFSKFLVYFSFFFFQTTLKLCLLITPQKLLACTQMLKLVITHKLLVICGIIWLNFNHKQVSQKVNGGGTIGFCRPLKTFYFLSKIFLSFV